MQLVTGKEAAQRVQNLINPAQQTHAYAVELTAKQIFSLNPTGEVDFGGSEYVAAEPQPLPSHQKHSQDRYQWWTLVHGAYLVEFNEVVELAQRNLITIYGISTVAYGFTSEGEANLTKLAEETGGRVEYPLQGVYKDVSGYLSTPSDEGNYALKVGTGGYASAIATGMFKSIAAVAGEVTTQYILRYIPDTSDSSRQFRNIDVRVALANVKVRARKGYYPYNP